MAMIGRPWSGRVLARMARVASYPFIRGIRRSIRIAS